MRTFLYRLTTAVLIVLTLAMLAASGLALMSDSVTASVAYLLGAALPFIMLLFVISEHQRATARVDAAPMISERPVMVYKGQVYDFVHNDPTALDPVV